MKHWIAVLSIACVMVALAGCERKKSEETSRFDPAIDSVSSSQQVAPDPNLLADQKKISQETSHARAAGSTARTESKTKTLKTGDSKPKPDEKEKPVSKPKRPARPIKNPYELD